MTDSISTKWWKTDGACRYAGVGRRTIYAAVEAGKLKAARLGDRGCLRFCQEWLDEWIEACATPVRVERRGGR